MINEHIGSAYRPHLEDNALRLTEGLQVTEPFAPRQAGIDGAGMALARTATHVHATPRAAQPETGTDDLSWFAVVTRSRHEKKVHDQLQSRDLEAFLPFVERWSRWRDRRKLIAWPLFPGYCFARCAPQHVRRVLACQGVVHLVSFSERPMPVPDHEIDGIRQLLASQLPHDPCPFIDVGMWVQVVYGPLRGVRGRLLHKGRTSTLIVAIEMLGRALSVGIDAADVEPLGTPS